MTQRTDNPAPSTIRGQRHRALRASGFAIYRVAIHEDQLTTLVLSGLLADRDATDQAAVERALTEHTAATLPRAFR